MAKHRAPTVSNCGDRDNKSFVDGLTLQDLIARTRAQIDGIAELLGLGSMPEAEARRRLTKALFALADVEGSVRRRRHEVLRFIDVSCRNESTIEEKVHELCSAGAVFHHDITLSDNPLATVDGDWTADTRDLAKQVIEVWPRRNRPKWPTVNAFLAVWGLECPNAKDLADEWIEAQKQLK